MIKIAILITSFLRDKLLYESVQSIIRHYTNNYIILVANQSYKTDEERLKGFSDFNVNIDNTVHAPIHYYNLPFDCGLSYARNFLVEKANSLGCKYCWLSADSIMFINEYNVNPIINFLEEDSKRGIVGVELYGRPEWHRDIDLVKGKHFHLKIPTRPIITFQDVKFIPCDVIKNIFIAKTECLINNKWDNELKLLEHEDFFWRLKNSDNSYQVFFTDYITTKYKDFKPNEYNKYRRRMHAEFRKKLQEKYKIEGWCKYDKR